MSTHPRANGSPDALRRGRAKGGEGAVEELSGKADQGLETRGGSVPEIADRLEDALEILLRGQEIHDSVRLTGHLWTPFGPDGCRMEECLAFLDKSKYFDILAGMATAARRNPTRLKVDPVLVARICHALSDETRLAILDRLRNGEQCVCNLMDILGTGQSRLSFHLKTLKDAGLVRDRRDGRWVHYSVNTETLAAIEAFIESFRAGKDEEEGSACCQK